MKNFLKLLRLVPYAKKAGYFMSAQNCNYGYTAHLSRINEDGACEEFLVYASLVTDEQLAKPLRMILDIIGRPEHKYHYCDWISFRNCWISISGDWEELVEIKTEDDIYELLHDDVIEEIRKESLI